MNRQQRRAQGHGAAGAGGGGGGFGLSPDLMKQAQDLQNSRPSLKNQGVQLMIGVEGTPIRVPAAAQAPTTQPAAH